MCEPRVDSAECVSAISELGVQRRGHSVTPRHNTSSGGNNQMSQCHRSGETGHDPARGHCWDSFYGRLGLRHEEWLGANNRAWEKAIEEGHPVEGLAEPWTGVGKAQVTLTEGKCS